MALRNLQNAARSAILVEPGSRAAVPDEAARLLERCDSGSSGTDPSGPDSGPGARISHPTLHPATGAAFGLRGAANRCAGASPMVPAPPHRAETPA